MNTEEIRVGTMVERLRKKRGLSGRALARLAGIAPGNLARIERGEGEPREGTIRALVKALNVPVGVLFGEIPEGTLVEGVTIEKNFLEDLPAGVTEELLEYLTGEIEKRLEKKKGRRPVPPHLRDRGIFGPVDK